MLFRTILIFCFAATIIPLSAADPLDQQLAQTPFATLEKNIRILGDPASGAILFHRQELACVQCHTIGEGEKQLGPDLSRLGQRATIRHVVESIIEPSKHMEHGYRSEQLLLDSGTVLSGIVRAETDDSVTLMIPGEEQPRTIDADEIELRKSAPSMMPLGLANQLDDEQKFYDLVAFLTAVGKAGPEGAKGLLPDKSIITPPPLPEYENDLDHAGLISSMDEASLKRGKKLYLSLCVNCHGTATQQGSLPNALRFASGTFKNGSDPYSMYKTVTHGYRMMLPQRQLVPRQKYEVIHYIWDEYLKDRGAGFEPVDLTYLASLPKGSKRGPEAVQQQPWRDMDYGPFLISTYEMVGPNTRPRLGITPEEQAAANREKRPPNEQWADDTNFAFKGIAVRLDEGVGGVSQGSRWLAFDHDTMRVAGAWTGEGFIDWHGILFDGRHAITPRTIGRQYFANPQGPGWANPKDGSFDDPRLVGRDGRRYGPLPRPWAKYRGLYKHGDTTIVSYQVGKVDVLESFAAESMGGVAIVKRTMNLGAAAHDVTMRVAHRPDGAQLEPVPSADSGRLAVRFDPPAGPAQNPTPTKKTFSFDGETYVELDAKGFETIKRDFTITANIKTKRGGTIVAHTVASPQWVPGGQTFFVRNGRLCFDVGWVGVVQSRERVDDDKPHHVAATYQSKTGIVTLFVDGKQVGSGTLRPEKTLKNSVLRVGYTNENFPGPQSHFDGALNEVRFYQRRLKEEELQPKATPSSQNLVARWNPNPSTTQTLPDLGTGRHPGRVVRGEATAPKSFGHLTAGVQGDSHGLTWSATEDGHLQLTIPAGEKPRKLTVWVASSADADTVGEIARKYSAPQPKVDLTQFTHGGPSVWPQRLRTIPTTETNGGPFDVDILSRPEGNPWKSRLRMSGVDFFEDGERLVACCCDGDVWIVEDIHNPDVISWRRIASGLFHPLGVKIVDGRIFVTCRDQIVLLNDLNGDGETDFYECFNNDHQVTDHFHEFAMGLQADEDGNLYYAKSARHARDSLVPQHGTLLRVTADGKQTEILANGFRAANGVCLNPDGSFFVTDQEGHWTPMNRINRVVPGGFYGNMYSYGAPDDTRDEAMELPLCWPNKEFDRSPSELLWVDSDLWGPLQGSLLNLSYGYGKVYVVPHEEVAGAWQGGMCRLPLPQFPTGVMRARFHPTDGQMYACGMHAWGSNQDAKKGGLYRIRYNGKPINLPKGLHANRRGIEIEFTEPVDRRIAEDPDNYLIETWSLKRSSNYGSRRHDERSWTVQSAKVAEDGRTVRLSIPEISPTWCMQIAYGLRDASGNSFKGVIQNTIYSLGK